MSDNQPIISLTDAAINHIKKILQMNSSSRGFRLSIKKTGCSGFAYVTDVVTEPKKEDIHYDFKGVSVFIDPELTKMIRGTVLDFVDKGLGQSKLVFNNPNAGSLCGCGESFTLDES